jgi:hypothetical protein
VLAAVAAESSLADVIPIAIVAVIAPAVMALLTAFIQSRSKRQDYERQDEVAARAEQVATQAATAAALLLEKQDQVAARTDAVAAQAAEAAALLLEKQDQVAERTDAVAATLLHANEEVAVAARTSRDKLAGKLDVIHTLVNSNLTAAIQSELVAIENQLVMMHEMVDLRKAAGQATSAGTLAAIGSLETHIEELRTQLAERKRQDELANAQLVKIVGMEPSGDHPHEDAQ